MPRTAMGRDRRPGNLPSMLAQAYDRKARRAALFAAANQRDPSHARVDLTQRQLPIRIGSDGTPAPTAGPSLRITSLIGAKRNRPNNLSNFCSVEPRLT